MAELLFSLRAQLANFELADFVSERLSGPYNVAGDFNSDVLIGFSGIVLKKLNGLFAGPAHCVYAGIHDQSHGTPHFVRKLPKFRIGIRVTDQFFAKTIAIERPAFHKS